MTQQGAVLPDPAFPSSLQQPRRSESRAALFVLLLAWLLTSGCSDDPGAVDYPIAYSGSGSHQAYVVGHRWHTGFVIPAASIYERLPALRQRFKEVAFLEFGWGDKGFYQAQVKGPSLYAKALLWPTPTVMHVVAVPSDVRAYFPASVVETLCLNDQELAALVQFISASFQRSGAGELAALEHGIYGNSQFYQGAGTYHAINTCNEWTAKGLQSVGMDIVPAFRLRAESITGYLGRLNSQRLGLGAAPAPGCPLGESPQDKGSAPSSLARRWAAPGVGLATSAILKVAAPPL